jgi:hypothetical protein
MAGELVFELRSASSDIRFGNVVGVDDNNIAVSYAEPERRRRGAWEYRAHASVLTAAEINPLPLSNEELFVAGEILLRKTGHDSAHAVLVMQDQAADEDTVLAACCFLDAEHGWTQIEAEEHFAVESFFRPRSLSLLSRWRFIQIVDPLIDALAPVIGDTLDIHEPALLRIGEIHVPVQAHVSVTREVVLIHLEAHCQVAHLIGSLKSEAITNEALFPVEPQSSWNASVVTRNSSTTISAASGDTGSIAAHSRLFTVSHAQGDPIVCRYTFTGAPIGSWSDILWDREPSLNIFAIRANDRPRSSIEFFAFGSRTVLYVPNSRSEEAKTYLAAARIGELTPWQRSVFVTFIGYITGGRASNVLTETFSIAAKLQTTVHDAVESTTRKQPPVPILRAGPYARLVTRHFETLLQAFERWRIIDEKTFDAVFHHYAEGVDSHYPVTRILRLSIALDAFINLVTQDKAENENILEKNPFNKLYGQLEKVAADFFTADGDKADTTSEARIRGKISGLNTASNTRRSNRFWTIVTIALDAADKKLLRRLRNESVHKGFVGDSTDGGDVLKDADDADRLCDILNRALLFYAGYTGPVLSSRDGKWITVTTGQRYHVPKLPDGLTINITHTLNARPLTPEEQQAVALLSQLQRDGQDDSSFIVDDSLSLSELLG